MYFYRLICLWPIIISTMPHTTPLHPLLTASSTQSSYAPRRVKQINRVISASISPTHTLAIVDSFHRPDSSSAHSTRAELTNRPPSMLQLWQRPGLRLGAGDTRGVRTREVSATFSALADGNRDDEVENDESDAEDEDVDECDDDRDDKGDNDGDAPAPCQPEQNPYAIDNTANDAHARPLTPTPPSSPDFYPAGGCGDLPGMPAPGGWDSSPEFFVSEANEYAPQPPDMTLGQPAHTPDMTPTHATLDVHNASTTSDGKSKVPSLFLLCQRALAGSLCPSTIVSTLHVSRLHMADELHQACRQWLQEKFDVFLVQGISEVDIPYPSHSTHTFFEIVVFFEIFVFNR